ncbi:hypothetical protein BH09MYX1_BH09MYX1_26070 [soil metagenome]
MLRLTLLLVALAIGACASTPSATTKSSLVVSAPPATPPKVEFGTFQGASFGAWLPPIDPIVDASGGFDLLVEFNAGMMAEKDVRELGARFVWACLANLGMGTSGYWNAFENAAHFGDIVSEVERGIQRSTGRKDAHARRIGLVGWSAGYAAVQQILRVQKYYDEIGVVILLDGLHTGYVHGPDGKATKEPELRTLGPVLRFAADATNGRKVFVFTHTAIIPPDYASTTEVAEAMIKRFGAARDGDSASLGDFHVLAHGGGGQKDHVDNLHLLAPVLRRWVLDRWR